MGLEVLGANLGNYPRPPDLRRAIDLFRRGELSKEGLNGKALECTNRVIRLQELAGLKVVTSGMLLWDDLVTRIMGELEGVELNGLLRFFDNNFYYRVPVVKRPLRRRGPITLDEYREAGKMAKAHLKAVLPGPLTLTYLSKNEYYSRLEDLLEDVSKILKDEVRSLSGLGIEYLQIDEPILVEDEVKDEHIKLGAELLKEIVAATPFKVIVATYFGCISTERYLAMLDAGVDLIGLDLVSCRRIASYAFEYGGGRRGLSLGVIDARNTRLEKVEEVLRVAMEFVDRIGMKELHLTPNAWLDYIPYERAFLKLKVLGEVVKAMEVKG